jgi:hypothetical protein
MEEREEAEVDESPGGAGLRKCRLSEMRDRVLLGIAASPHSGPGDGRDRVPEKGRSKIGDLLTGIELLNKSPKKLNGRCRWAS